MSSSIKHQNQLPYLPFMFKHPILVLQRNTSSSTQSLSSSNSLTKLIKTVTYIYICVCVCIYRYIWFRVPTSHTDQEHTHTHTQKTNITCSRNMRTKTHPTLNVRLLIVGVFLAFVVIFVLRSSFDSSPASSDEKSTIPVKEAEDDHEKSTSCDSTMTCNKIPTSLAKALIHYTTSTITPQQTLKEISVTSKVLDKKSPCNFLVFGLGHDSLMWTSLNHGGRTIFLEEDESWIEQIRRRFPTLESYHVTYDSKVNEANNLLGVGKGPECSAVGDPRYSMCQLALKGLPSEVYEIKWDLIMVDAPTGYHDEAPGRMSAIYTAGMMARNKVEGETDVFVHDVNRDVEDKFSKAFLCEGYMKKQVGRLRHFNIPSHRDASDRPFCPE